MTRWVLGGAVVVILGTFIATGAVAWHEGYRLYAVKTGSMTPGLPVGSLLIDAPASGHYQRGDVVTVERGGDASNRVVTHRVYAVGSGGGIRTKGDANPDPDVSVARPSAVVGEVIHHVPYGGYVLVYLSQWTGVASLMMVLLTLWLAWGMFFPAAVSASAGDGKARASKLRVPQQRQAPLTDTDSTATLPPVPSV
jgi:signal peptidase